MTDFETHGFAETHGFVETHGLPPSAFALALATLPGAGPASLRAALEGRTPGQAWSAVLDGEIRRPPPRSPAPGRPHQPAQLALVEPESRRGARPAPRSWQVAARDCDPGALWRAAQARGIGVTWLGDHHYPGRLAHDGEAPPILTWRGDLRCLLKPTVAIVGTRHCTPAGRTIAADMARDLAEAGVCVVSGLALGIDGSAHRGALAASTGNPVTAGIAASGVDVPYPRQHGELWEQVVTRGVVVSETAPGRPAQAWRFPARNRIIATVADLVAVVESFEAGGSLLTVDAALARGIDVRAVPGPVHSPASSGTNRLLVDGAAPVRHAGDILDALGIDRRRTPPKGPRPGDQVAEVTAPVDLAPTDRRILEAVGWAPTSLGRIVDRSGSTLRAAMAALARLEGQDLVVAGASWWVRRPRD